MLCIVFEETGCDCVSVCIQMHQILMDTWSLVEPHYHNFFWGKSTKSRIEIFFHCYTTAELQAKAVSKNSLKVSYAVNQFLSSHTGSKKWKKCIFILVLLINIQSLCGLFLFITAFNHLAQNYLPGAGNFIGSAFNNTHPEWIKSFIPAYNTANGYPWLCNKPLLAKCALSQFISE